MVPITRNASKRPHAQSEISSLQNGLSRNGLRMLINLPGEIRNIIYEFALTASSPLIPAERSVGRGIIPSGGLTNLTKPYLYTEEDAEMKKKSVKYPDSTMSAVRLKLWYTAASEYNQLKYVNRLLRKETKGIELQFNAITFADGDYRHKSATQSFLHFIDKISPAKRKWLNEVFLFSKWTHWFEMRDTYTTVSKAASHDKTSRPPPPFPATCNGLKPFINFFAVQMCLLHRFCEAHRHVAVNYVPTLLSHRAQEDMLDDTSAWSARNRVVFHGFFLMCALRMELPYHLFDPQWTGSTNTVQRWLNRAARAWRSSLCQPMEIMTDVNFRVWPVKPGLEEEWFERYKARRLKEGQDFMTVNLEVGYLRRWTSEGL
ncbi:hypothetical protein BS50DRAFT_152883 [Corynespora cassiicola Philippines]|uniref:Uncharacterized protein n=1 Tax=Corynespora cassiicola Philippines TaxID=1448308 RepID=A0A2T2N7V8_CORCC|nr:hypothetical protein BS50DRAFT_152883 [Corynespora cassiicola Philippines]